MSRLCHFQAAGLMDSFGLAAVGSPAAGTIALMRTRQRLSPCGETDYNTCLYASKNNPPNRAESDSMNLQHLVLCHTFVTSLMLVASQSFSVVAREIHVAKTGTAHGTGAQQDPLLEINQAVQAAQPGDMITVHAGAYREWVRPVRGGTGPDRRITFRAAPGETVWIKGSEQVDSWIHEDNGVWRLELPNTYFGDYNPFALKISGGWLNYGQWHHRGDVYRNGEAFCEKQTIEEVMQSVRSWHCQVDDDRTIIRANFGDDHPNTELTEINVRESLFMPDVTGLKYITVDGFHFAHAAANWAPPVIELQTGAIGPRMGKHWIIQNCTVTNARCVGIILGQAPGVDYDDIEAYGDHIVRHNVIRRCGQAGIAGQKGATRSLIANNLIEETNYRREFGGWETAAIKFHNSVDTVIEGNLIRGVFRQIQGAFGIWIDFGNQGVRITAQYYLRYGSCDCVSGDEPRTDSRGSQHPDRPACPQQLGSDRFRP